VTKRVQAKQKICRSLGVNLWGSDKYNQNKNYPPGQHGPANILRRKSDYAIHLTAKQKLKKYYSNISEKQFRGIFKEAKRRKGDAGENFIGLLEARLDAVLYRSGFVPSTFSARQLVSHKHVLVNGAIVNIPSYRLKIGDVVSIKTDSRNIPMILESVQKKDKDTVSYLKIDYKKCSTEFLAYPNLEDVPYPVTMEPNLIVEYYSK
jgi:small subunit ribosomal protein S4